MIEAVSGVGRVACLCLLSLAWVCNIVVAVGAVGSLRDYATLLCIGSLNNSGPVSEDTLDAYVSVVECLQYPHSAVKEILCRYKSFLCVWVRTRVVMVLKVSPAVRRDSLGDLASSDDLILFNSFSRSFSVADLRNTAFADVP